jgi:hypothetical protein
MSSGEAVREMQNTATLNDRHLPKSKALLNEKKAEVRKCYGLDEPAS